MWSCGGSLSPSTKEADIDDVVLGVELEEAEGRQFENNEIFDIEDNRRVNVTSLSEAVGLQTKRPVFADIDISVWLVRPFYVPSDFVYSFLSFDHQMNPKTCLRSRMH